MDKTFLIDNQAAADFLTDIDTRKLLAPFMLQERSLSEAAKILNLKLTSLSYHVKKMLKLDLVKVTKTEVRNGHKVKLYKSTSQEYLIPLEASSSMNLAEHIQRIIDKGGQIYAQGLSSAMLSQSDTWGFKVCYISNHGVVQTLIAKNQEGEYDVPETMPQALPYHASDGELTLNDKSAQSLTRG